MSSPFSRAFPNGQPPWAVLPPNAGNFMRVTVLGLGYQEVLYGQGGFGDGGYDTPSSSSQAAGTPNWTTGSTE